MKRSKGKGKGGTKKQPAQPAKTAALIVERLPLSDLKPHPRNPRIHPETGSPEWNALRVSLEHDYFDPIVFNRRNGLLVSGHLRVKVLAEAGFTAADCVIVDYDEPIHLARMIAANRGAGEDSMPDLKDLLQELDTGAMDMGLTGFTDDAIGVLMSQFMPEEDLKQLSTQLPPALAWALIGIPITSFGKVQALLDQLTDPTAIIHTTFTDEIEAD